MHGSELLWEVHTWLPVVFALDLAVFHLTGDHPLALRWWRGRARRHRSTGSVFV